MLELWGPHDLKWKIHLINYNILTMQQQQLNYCRFVNLTSMEKVSDAIWYLHLIPSSNKTKIKQPPGALSEQIYSSLYLYMVLRKGMASVQLDLCRNHQGLHCTSKPPLIAEEAIFGFDHVERAGSLILLGSLFCFVKSKINPPTHIIFIKQDTSFLHHVHHAPCILFFRHFQIRMLNYLHCHYWTLFKKQ